MRFLPPSAVSYRDFFFFLNFEFCFLDSVAMSLFYLLVAAAAAVVFSFYCWIS